MAPSEQQNAVLRFTDRLGRATVAGIGELGTCGVLIAESLYWLVLGPRLRQPVRLGSVFVQMMEIGIFAVPIVGIMGGTIGVMLAIQGIHTLKIFGAESRVVIGIALSVTREFAPLITGILVAGRSGSALAARLGTMKISQEIDALSVMGINPVRFLVVPSMLAMLIMVPALTFFADLVGLAAETQGGETLGTVRAVHDFGAGGILEIAGAEDGPGTGDGKDMMVPFTDEVVPEIDLNRGRVIIIPPDYVEAGGPDGEQGPNGE